MKKALLVLFLSFLPGLLLLYMCYWFFCGPYEVKKIKCAHDYAYTDTSYNPISGCWYWNEHILKMTNVFDCSYRDSFDYVSPEEIREQIDRFYYAADIYENDVKMAYGLTDAYDFLNTTAVKRIGYIIKSRFLSSFSGKVDKGRGGLRGTGYMFGWMCGKQFQDAYHAITGAQAHFPSDPDSPVVVLLTIEQTKHILEDVFHWQPSAKFKTRSQTQERTPEEKDIDEYQRLLKKYGYK